MSAAQMVIVPFHGANLEAAEVDGKVWVSVRRMCEALEVDPDAQRKRLADVERSPWACTVMMAVHDTTGRRQDAFCLDLDSVPMWLATIDSSRVASHLREKIVLFQREAAKALRDHFFGVAPKAPTSFLEALRLAADLEEKRIALVAEVAVLAPKARAVRRAPAITTSRAASDCSATLRCRGGLFGNALDVSLDTGADSRSV